MLVIFLILEPVSAEIGNLRLSCADLRLKQSVYEPKLSVSANGASVKKSPQTSIYSPVDGFERAIRNILLKKILKEKRAVKLLVSQL